MSNAEASAAMLHEAALRGASLGYLECLKGLKPSETSVRDWSTYVRHHNRSLKSDWKPSAKDLEQLHRLTAKYRPVK
jgi:hypothetical protein